MWFSSICSVFVTSVWGIISEWAVQRKYKEAEAK